MALIPAPGVAELRLVGKVGPNVHTEVLHWYAGTAAAWPLSTLQLMVDTAFTAVGAHLAPAVPAQVTWDYAEGVDLTDAVLREHKTTGPSKPGTLGGAMANLGACVMFKHSIGARYRGGHPRTYFPGGGTAASNDGDAWTPSYLSTWQTGFDAFINQIAAAVSGAGLASNVPCTPRYTYTYTNDANKHKYLKERSGFIAAYPILDSTADPQIRTQRRRLGK